jgi:glycosyltransferase involved in cell wall biosynthesis
MVFGGYEVKILFVYNHDRSFVHKDIKMLSNDHEVTPLFYKKEKNRLKKEVKKNDLIISRFASKHSIKTFGYAKKYNKKTMVIVGGFDASDIKGYGLFSSPIKRRLASYIYNKADLIVPVDESLQDVIVKYLPHLEKRITVIPSGYDSTYFKPKGKKKNQVLSVCYVDETNWWRKGIKTLVGVAKEMPDVKFIVVGKVSEDVKEKVSSTPENITFTGWITDEELLQKYQESKVIALLSKYEGLPNVLCEAMLCECIPVTTGVCGIPNAQGDVGYYVSYDDMKETREAMEKALNSKADTKKIRKRIKDNFTIEQREMKFRTMLKMGQIWKK